MEYAALLMFRKAAHIIQHSFATLSYQVYLTELFYIPEDNHSKIYTSTGTTHVRTMQGNPLNVFMQKIQRISSAAYSPELAPSDFSLLVASSENSLSTTPLTGRADKA
jgi:hypothetical protein